MKLTPRLEAAIRWLISDDKAVNAYIYDPAIMRKRLSDLLSIMPEGVEIYYAMKANPHTAFLEAAAKAKGIEIASLGEAEKAVQAGYKPSQFIFTGPGKSMEELVWSVEQGVRTVHLESLTEAYRLQSICARLDKHQDVLLRVNANYDMHESQTSFTGGSRKFGIDEEMLADVLPKLLSLDRLRFHGLHVYCASGVLKVKDLLMNCRLVFDLVQQIEQANPGVQCDIIDFGGGFGVDYLETGKDFDPEAYAKGLQALIDEYGYAGRTFVLELGRYLAAPAGWFCTEIIDIKESRGKKQVICAGGINHFRRPAALSINHPVTILRLEKPCWFKDQVIVRDEDVYMGGPLCTSADKLANNIHIEEADIGDIAVFGLAGAYGLSMSNIEFLSHRRPPEVVL